MSEKRGDSIIETAERPPAYPLGERIQKAVDSQCYIVLSNCPDVESAEAIGRALVGSGLAAAVNLLPGARSIYRWHGQIRQNNEVVLLIKTSAARYPQVEERVRAMHPYELPGIVALPVADGSSEYLQWIGTQVSVE